MDFYILLLILAVGIPLALLCWILTYQAFKERLRSAAPDRRKTRLEILFYLFLPLSLLAALLLILIAPLVIPVLTVIGLILLPFAFLAVLVLIFVPYIPPNVNRLKASGIEFGKRIFRFILDAPLKPYQKYREFFQSLRSSTQLVMLRNPRFVLDFEQTSIILNKLGIQHAREPILLALANDPLEDLGIRIRAVERLGRYNSFEHLSSLACDPAVPPSARIRASEILYEKGQTAPALEAWKALAKQPGGPQLCLKVAEKLLEGGYLADGCAILENLLAQQDLTYNQRGKIARLLGEYGDTGVAKRDLLTLARARYISPTARLNAAAALGYLGDVQDAVENLSSLADEAETSRWMRRVAVRILGELGQFEPLKLLAKDPARNIRLRTEIASDLERRGRLGEALEAWLSIFDQDTLEVKARIDAAGELGRLGYQPVLGALSTWGRDPDLAPVLRLEAARVLGKLGFYAYAKQILFLLLGRPAVNGRVAAAARELLNEIDSQTDPRRTPQNTIQ